MLGNLDHLDNNLEVIRKYSNVCRIFTLCRYIGAQTYMYVYKMKSQLLIVDQIRLKSEILAPGCNL